MSIAGMQATEVMRRHEEMPTVLVLNGEIVWRGPRWKAAAAMEQMQRDLWPPEKEGLRPWLDWNARQ